VTNSLDENKPAGPKRSRLQGVLIFAFAVFAGYVSIVLPLQEASAHAPQIEWGAQLAFLAPPLALLGILTIIFPSMTTNDTFLLKSKDKLSVSGWILLAVLAALGAGTAYLVDHQLQLLGYVDRLPISGSK
jgi:hypothetical protein